MKTMMRNLHKLKVLPLTAAFAVVIMLLSVYRAAAQDAAAPPPGVAPAAPALVPAVKDLHGISVGMSADEVKKKLGKALTADESGMYYSFSRNESAQIGLDEQEKVKAVALIFTDGDSKAPSFADIFGPSVPVAKKDDGSIYQMIRYRDAGYWVAYSRTTGDNPMTVVTMRRINKR